MKIYDRQKSTRKVEYIVIEKTYVIQFTDSKQANWEMHLKIMFLQ